jgi:hypothetical protein
MIGLLFGKAKLYLVAAGAIVLAIVGAFFKGRADQKRREELKDEREYRETRERMDAVDRIDSPADAREWLRERGKR